jgi:hypothetical protein
MTTPNASAGQAPVFKTLELRHSNEEGPTAAFWPGLTANGPHVSGTINYFQDGIKVARRIAGFFKISERGESSIRFSERSANGGAYVTLGTAYLTKEKLFRFFPNKSANTGLPDFTFGGTTALDPKVAEAIGVAYLTPANTHGANHSNHAAQTQGATPAQPPIVSSDLPPTAPVAPPSSPVAPAPATAKPSRPALP